MPELSCINTRWLSSSTASVILFNLLLLFSFSANAQHTEQSKQPSPSVKLVKVGLVDHSRLRKEFREFDAEKRRLSDAYRQNQLQLKKSLTALEAEETKQLRTDSVRGGRKQARILQGFQEKKSALQKKHQDDVIRMNNERNLIMKKYEQKIVLAIEAVVSEKGLTNVVPLSDKLIEQDGLNITDTILEKLNKN